MNIRFYNARVLAMAGNMEIVTGEVWVKGSRIAAVGSPKPDGTVWDREVDVGKNLLMPGFKNAHTHSAMTFLRSFADGMPLADWLNKRVFPMEARLEEEDIYHLSKLAILEYLTSGITANFDMYLIPESIARASVDTGFRTVLTGTVNDRYQSVPEMEGWYQKYNQYHERISYMLGFHSEYTTSLPLLEEIAALSKQLQAPVYSHNSETVSEVMHCKIRYEGLTPTGRMARLGMYDYGGGGYHCVFLSEDDFEIFRSKGLYAITNPGANIKLASGMAPIQRMLELGIPIAIGTDSAACNNSLDMFREMFLVTGLAKLREKNAAAVEAAEVLKMACCNGARAMGLDDCDSLQPGKLADLIVIDLNQPNMQPLNNIAGNIVYSGSKRNVKLTMVNGEILYEDGKFFIGTEPEELYEKVNAIVDRIK